MTTMKDLRFECADCGVSVLHRYDEDTEIPYAAMNHLCALCERGYPESLLKAVVDPFDYALCLRSGDVVRFESARLRGAFVHLKGVREWDHESAEWPGFTFDRGVDVRRADIVWCCDAPQGS